LYFCLALKPCSQSFERLLILQALSVTQDQQVRLLFQQSVPKKQAITFSSQSLLQLQPQATLHEDPPLFSLLAFLLERRTLRFSPERRRQLLLLSKSLSLAGQFEDLLNVQANLLLAHPKLQPDLQRALLLLRSHHCWPPRPSLLRHQT
jgi:hypothetical protein